MQKKVKLQKTNAITVFGAGHQALAEIEGLRGMAVRYDGGKKTHKWCE